MSFSINCLEITATREQWKVSKSLYKNLLSEKDYDDFDEHKINPDEAFKKRFFFNDFYLHNQHGDLDKARENRFNSDIFFGKGINIQAIVGMNGSGKSSLMDLLYMAINNFVYMFERGKRQKGIKLIFFVKNLYVKIYYSINDKICTLICNGENLVKLETGENDSKRTFHIDDVVLSPKSKEEIKEIVEPFFYTVVSNYAPQSFISSNYNHDALVFNLLSHKSESNLQANSSSSWIDSHFKKNDSYVRSMVINPTREYGKLDMELEKQISTNRLISLFIFSQETDSKFLPDYSLENIGYTLNTDFIKNKFPFFEKLDDAEDFLLQQDDGECTDEYIAQLEEEKKDKKGDERDQIERALQVEKTKSRYAKLHAEIQKKYFWGPESSKTLKCAIMYLVYKIDKVVRTYSEFKDYREGAAKSIYNFGDKIDGFLDEIQHSSSHAVSKIKQTVHLLSVAKSHYDFELGECEDDLGAFDSSFDYNIYKEKLSNRYDSLDVIIEQLPPPFFEYEMKLKKKSAAGIPVSGISSGEMQFLQTFATHAYHIRNLMSIDENSVKYKVINAVFDELELCFHPEFQRVFIKNLVGMLNSLQKDDCEFNVFVVTHSPFILSDLPPERILYLKEGFMDVAPKISSFAGNIGEMFYDSFFLKSTIGAFAEEKIKKAVKYRQMKNPDEEKDLAEQNKSPEQKEYEAVVKNIGDPVIRSLIEEVEVDDIEESSEEEIERDV